MKSTSISGERLKRPLDERLRQPDYRRAFVERQTRHDIAGQIRAMRAARNWSQSDLAEKAGVTQSMISRLESFSYGKPTVETLRALADVFDVGLAVRFVPFSEMVLWEDNLTPEALAPASFENEYGGELITTAQGLQVRFRVAPASNAESGEDFATAEVSTVTHDGRESLVA